MENQLKKKKGGKVYKTITTWDDSIKVELGKAHTWIANYDVEYVYNGINGNGQTGQITHPDQELQGWHNVGIENDVCGKIKEAISKVVADVNEQYRAKAEEESRQKTESQTPDASGHKPIVPVEAKTISEGDVITSGANVTERVDRVEIVDTTYDYVEKNKYTPNPPVLKIKDDKTTAPNFVTLFNKFSYRDNRNSILSAPEWLFEILEANDKTKNLVETIKYLLYKATGTSYGVTDVKDIEDLFYPGSLNSVGISGEVSEDGTYIVDTTKSPEGIVIKDVETLKRAFSGYPTNHKLIEHAQDFLDMQEKYHVNAVFAAAVSIGETTAGTAGYAETNNNWWNYLPIHNMARGAGGWASFPSAREGILGFGEWISDTSGQVLCAFGVGNFTVGQIGYGGYCDPPDIWVNSINDFMTQMFQAAGS